MDFLKMIAYGIEAPSGHNTQPWRFKVNENSIEVYPNFEKELPVVDQNHRELYISIGCAVENICIAASQFGYIAEPKIIQKNSLFYIEIKLKKDKVNKDPLFEQIHTRQTNRSVYKSKNINDENINSLKKIDICENVSIHFYKNGSEDFIKLSEYIYKGNEILFQNKEFKKELLDWMRFNKKEVEKNKDGLAYSCLGAPSFSTSLGKGIVKGFLKAKPQNKTEKKNLKSSSHLVLITTKESNPENWILAGRSLERFWLKCTELGIALAFSNQPCEVDIISNKIKEEMNINNNYPMVLMRIGYANSMPYSARKSIDEVIIE